MDFLKVECYELDVLEERLRSTIAEHKDLLKSLIADEMTSRNEFVSQLMDRVAECDTITHYDGGSVFKLVALDVEKESIWNRLAQQSEKDLDLEAFLNKNCGDAWSELLSHHDDRVIAKPHVTLAHPRNVPRQQIQDRFGPVTGETVRLQASSILWGENVAALAVQVNEKSKSGKVVPRSYNEFVHITIWVEHGGSSVQSNELPKEVESGAAQCYHFKEPFVLEGTLSFWAK